jgi:hypothetical protein
VRATSAPIGGEVVRVLRHVEPGGLQEREEAHLPRQLGMVLEHEPERLEAADDVLRGVRAVHAQDELAVVREMGLGEIPGVLGHGGAVGELAQGVDVDGDGIEARAHRAPADLDGQALEVDRQVRAAPGR